MFIVAGSNVIGGSGGSISFQNTSTADHANIRTMTGRVRPGQTIPGVGGRTAFVDSSTAGDATLIALSSRFTTGGSAGEVAFSDTATAGNSKLHADIGDQGGVGGAIVFLDESSGGTAEVVVGGAGYLDVSGLNLPSLTIGSLDGSGTAFLGGKKLVVGSNEQSTTFAGTLQDGGRAGGSGGSLTKIGGGTLTLSGANTYTGGTVISGGMLIVDGSLGTGAGSAGVTAQIGSSTGNVTVTAGGTLSGTGTIKGELIVEPGGVVDFDAGTLTVNGAITNGGLFVFKNGGHIAGATSFINNGVIDVSTSSGFTPPPGFVNNGVIIDSTVIKIRAALKAGATMTVTINSYTGHTYQLQKTATLMDDFENVGDPQQGNTGTLL
jgi:autotransporter-associated beta strand protein